MTTIAEKTIEESKSMPAKDVMMLALRTCVRFEGQVFSDTDIVFYFDDSSCLSYDQKHWSLVANSRAAS